MFEHEFDVKNKCELNYCINKFMPPHFLNFTPLKGRQTIDADYYYLYIHKTRITNSLPVITHNIDMIIY